ncbi:MAG: tRNA preQ1(34) S-adenosylmethionine ribosyltransferase-isomerase QueA [Patescibacteria group bacterium]|jgi:S-adenosylmethionine:tRNA ribosyltransferase-isomerase
MRLSEFDYQLPPQLIAQTPIEPRDHSRLLVVHRDTGKLEHKQFFHITDYLKSGDVLVINTSKVIKARLHATKPTGGKVEIFLLQQKDDFTWECLIKGKTALNSLFLIHHSTTATVQEKHPDSTYLVKFNKTNITQYGEVPLPPYIKTKQSLERYQTVYADQSGSVAAPTAGLHFTEALLDKLKKHGVIIVPVILHVGLGTFTSVKTDDITQHTMHAEYAVLPEATAQAMAAAKKTGHKIIAVGTTSGRTLEAFQGQANAGWVNIYIYPGYKFNTVDSLITNFHLPKTTLLMLVSALAGKPLIDRAYAEAIKEHYRFFSFGDAMLID